MLRLTHAVSHCVLTLILITSATVESSAQSSKQKWKLIWQDEFNAQDGAPVDKSKWTPEVGGHWWNKELQYYTDRIDNAFQSNGSLVIKAIKEEFSGRDNVTRGYTSARLITKQTFSTTYGRFEARIKLPRGQGIWPAFWLLGNDIGKVGWPKCGEIDIMELIGKEPSTIHGTIHGPGYSGSKGLSSSHSLADGKQFADAFHVFAIEWEPKTIRFYCDDVLYKTVTTADLPPRTTWVYGHPFYILLNVAVGGEWPGNPDSTTSFPQVMLVDYIRVFKKS